MRNLCHCQSTQKNTFLMQQIMKEAATKLSKIILDSTPQRVKSGTVSHPYLYKFLKRDMQNKLLISVTLTPQSRVTDEKIAHGEAGGFIPRVAASVVDFVPQIQHFPVVRRPRLGRCVCRREHIHGVNSQLLYRWRRRRCCVLTASYE
jgi:hypothetical protein